MKADNKNVKVSYDSDADVLSIEGTPAAVIHHAREMGNLIVHFGKNDEPVLIEVLEASQVLHGQGESLARIAAVAAKV